MPIAAGSQVELEYVLTLASGEIVERTEPERPLRFVCGGGEILPAMDQAVLGMEENQEKDFELGPAEAYGDRDPEAVLTVPRGEIPPDVTLEEGLVYMLRGEEQQERMVTIASVSETEVILDFNHPLAGQTLRFHVRIVSVQNAQA
jgi:FKBP-type peptidyl-prolyl cis-trans isomerase 2